MDSKYPLTRSQEQTAIRRGWTYRVVTSKSKGTARKVWTAPNNFTQGDAEKIQAAVRRRFNRQRSAD